MKRSPLAAHAINRARDLMVREDVAGLVLTTPGAVAWATGGMNVPIDRAAPVDTVWVAIGRETAAIVTTNVEGPRIEDENVFDEECALFTAPWWEPNGLAAAAAGALGIAPDLIASDGCQGFGRDLSFALASTRLALSSPEQAAITELGQLAAGAVEMSLREWLPGEPDRAIAARIAARVEAFGGQAPVLLVGGDDRLRAYRHPVAVGIPVKSVVMAVLVASRAGLHVALTRYASAGPIDTNLAAGLATVQSIHQAMLAACQVGTTIGGMAIVMDDAYALAGQRTGWMQHYQGGPIGYAQRECEIAPGQAESPWWGVELPEGCAVAWNPSVPGGAKDEDTHLLTASGPVCITTTGNWPTTGDPAGARPAVLDIND